LVYRSRPARNVAAVVAIKGIGPGSQTANNIHCRAGVEAYICTCEFAESDERQLCWGEETGRGCVRACVRAFVLCCAVMAKEVP
jgi:hypothetical protein